MRTRAQRSLALFLAALALCLTVLPASAAESATAAAMQLMKTEGDVTVSNSSGRGLSMRANMRLYNGYKVETRSKSYAWISLDDTKLAKLDAASKAEVRKSGKKLELLLSSGNLFFNITKPLDSDEALNVRTSTMVVGIRGTSGWIKVLDRWSAEIYVLEGTVLCDVTDPVTGQVKTAEIQGGEKAVATAYPQDQPGDKCDIFPERFDPSGIDGFVLTELAQDPELCADIYEKTGMDVLEALEAAQDRLEQDELAMQDALDRVESDLADQDSNVTAGGVWEDATPPPIYERNEDNGGDSDSSDSGDSGYTMPLTDIQVQGYLNEAGAAEVTLLAGSGPADNTLTVENIDMIIPSGKTLILSAGIHVAVNSGKSLTVSGTMTGSGSLTNNGSLMVNSSGTLSMASVEGSGSLTNNGNGRIAANVIYLRADSINSGVIEGGVTVESGTFTMNGGKIDGGSDGAVVVSDGAAFLLSGGEILSSDSSFTVNCDGSLTLSGGTITNNGEGRALHAASVVSDTIGSTVIRAKQKEPFVVGDGPGMLNGYGRRYQDTYYCVVTAEAYGDCGNNAVWDYSGGVLTITGTGSMDDYGLSGGPWPGAGQISAVTIGNGVTGIGTSAFSDCGSLESVTIPVEVTDIGDHAFSNCNNLNRVYYSGSEEQWNRIRIGENNDPLRSAVKSNGAENWQ